MMVETRVELLRSDRGQDIHLPEAFVLPGDAAILRLESGRLTVEPIASSSPLAVSSRLQASEEIWPDIEDRPPVSVEL